MSAIAYRRDIDGLRAIAVLLVVFHHFHFSGFSGGYIGVDVFFVISGYLIGAILIKELRETGRLCLCDFYVRRARRILPALLMMTLAVSAMAYCLFQADDLLLFGQSIFAALFFYSNIWFMHEADNYFAAQGAIWPLLHTWSLAVEEQYYLLFPVILLCLRRWQKHFSAVFIGLCLLGLAVSEILLQANNSASFYLLPSRMWELLLGVVLAARGQSFMTHRAVAECAAIAGVAGIFWAGTHYSGQTAFPGLNALVPCIGAALLIESGRGHTTWVGRVLMLWPVVLVGKISYSLYLWHWPLLLMGVSFFGRSLTPSELCFCLVLCFVMSILSWRLVELPLRDRQRSSNKKALMLLAGLALVIVAFGAAAQVSRGMPDRIEGRVYYPQEMIASYRGDECFIIKGGFADLAPQCLQTASDKPNILLWGDSLAAQYYPGLKLLADQGEISLSQYTKAGCPPIVGLSHQGGTHCDEFHQSAIAHINRNIFDIVLVSGNFLNARGYSMDDYLRHFFQTLEQISPDAAKILVVGPGLSFNREVYKIISGEPRAKAWLYKMFGIPAVARIVETNQNLSGVEQRLQALFAGSRFGYIPVVAALCPQGICPYQREDGTLLVSDKVHVTNVGSAYVVQRVLKPALEEALP